MTYTDTRPTKTGWHVYCERCKGPQAVWITIGGTYGPICTTQQRLVSDMPGQWSRRLVEEATGEKK